MTNAHRIDETAWEYAKAHLQQEHWSPEQITGRLKRDGAPPISHETIYPRVLSDKKAGGHLYLNLHCEKNVMAQEKQLAVLFPIGLTLKSVPLLLRLETEQDLQQVENKLNSRPGKCLDYQTSFEVFNKSCQKKGIALRI